MPGAILSFILTDLITAKALYDKHYYYSFLPVKKAKAEKNE